jgi:hypothetical protein
MQPLSSLSFSSPDAIVEHAMNLTSDCIKKGVSQRRLEQMRRDLPYRFMSIGDGVQILVNRDYKPCGDPPRPGYWARYEEWPHHHLRLTREEGKAIVLPPLETRRFGSVRRSPQPTDQGPLFDDGCAPWISRAHAREYLARLSALSQVVARALA